MGVGVSVFVCVWGGGRGGRQAVTEGHIALGN